MGDVDGDESVLPSRLRSIASPTKETILLFERSNRFRKGRVSKRKETCRSYSIRSLTKLTVPEQGRTWFLLK